MKPLTNVTQEKIMLEVLKLDKEKNYDVEIREHKERRSKDANAYFHLLVNKLARHYGTSDDEMKIKMNLAYGTVAKRDGKVVGAKYPKGTNATEFYEYSKWYGEEDNLDLYIFYERTHLLNTKEMASLIDGVVTDCQEAGIETLTPAELNLLKESWK